MSSQSVDGAQIANFTLQNPQGKSNNSNLVPNKFLHEKRSTT